MTRIKLCGLTRPCDIGYANELLPEYIGFVFAKQSRRYLSPETAAELRQQLDSRITPVGVFVDAAPETVAQLVGQGIIDLVQLHGHEDDAYIAALRRLTDCPIVQAFCIRSSGDILAANQSLADYVLLDSGDGTGTAFDHRLLREMTRPYFLAGGLTPASVGEAVRSLAPFAVDASSSLETEGVKDKQKMTAFVEAVRKE